MNIKTFAQQFNISTMEEHKTNRDLLVKGIQNLGLCVILMFLGPTLLYIAFSNQEKSTYILVLILAIMICGFAVFFLFRGIHIIMKSMFDK